MRSTACDDNLGATVAGQGRARPTLRLLQTRCLPGIASRRRGLTLLEVLIAIFVLLFGLLGVLALIPVAMYRMNQALTADRATAVAQAAMEEIKVRGMLDPAMWVRRNSGSWALVTTATFGASYAIDPWFIAQTTADATDPTAFDTANAQSFPLRRCCAFSHGASQFRPTRAVHRSSASDDRRRHPARLRLPRRPHGQHTGRHDPTAAPRLQHHIRHLRSRRNQSGRQRNRRTLFLAGHGRPGRGERVQRRRRRLPRSRYVPADADHRARSQQVRRARRWQLEHCWAAASAAASSASHATTAAQLSALPGDWMLLCGTGNIFCWYRIVSLGEVQSDLHPRSNPCRTRLESRLGYRSYVPIQPLMLKPSSLPTWCSCVPKPCKPTDCIAEV